MSDELVVSGGGTIAVATDEMWGRLRRLEEYRGHVADATAQLTRVDRMVTDGGIRHFGAPPSALHAEQAIDDAARHLVLAKQRGDRLAEALDQAMRNYGAADAFGSSLVTGLQNWFAANVGRVLPLILVKAFPVLGGILTGIGGAAALSPDGAAAMLRGGERWLRENGELVTNPVIAWLVRSFASSSDDLIGGAVGAPPALTALLGEQGLGLLGVSSTASVIIGLASPFGLFRETPVRIDRVGGVSSAAAPTGFADRFSRIPEGPASVRVERYPTADGHRFEVFVGGTTEFSPIASTDPSDSTSNLHAAADSPSGAARTVEAALRAAGATSADPVTFTGYSQGGLVATTVATSGDWNTAGLVTFGSPTAHLPVPEGVPVVAVEHTDDVVPALGGTRSEREAVLVQREAFAGQAVPTEETFPAHRRDAYLETARLMDGAESPLVTGSAERLDAGGDARGRVTTYRGERITE